MNRNLALYRVMADLIIQRNNVIVLVYYIVCSLCNMTQLAEIEFRYILIYQQKKKKNSDTNFENKIRNVVINRKG